MPRLILWIKRLLQVAVVAAVIAWFGSYIVGYFADRREMAGFEILAGLERDMIKAGGPGVIVSPGGQVRVRTFADFYSYVARVRPSAVRSPNYLPTSQPAESSIPSPNPFPGILPDREYWLTDTETDSPVEDIISTVPHVRWTGTFRAILDASGRAYWHGMGQ